MDEARKKIRMCLIFVVTAAVIIGLIYYFRDIKGNQGVTEGTLIRRTEEEIRPRTGEESRKMTEIIRDGGNGCGWKNG